MEDGIREEVANLVEYIRHRPGKGLELELRVGKFGAGGQFTSGYEGQFFEVIKRMRTRLDASGVKDPTHWKTLEKVMMMRCHYPNGIRKTVVPRGNDQKTTVYEAKKRLTALNLRCVNRAYDLRIQLSEERRIDPVRPDDRKTIESLEQTPHESLRYVLRGTSIFTPPLPEGWRSGPIRFQYDLSKVSASAPTKLEATRAPVFYHVEVELLAQLRPLVSLLTDAERADEARVRQAKTQEHLEDRVIAQQLIECGRSVLGQFSRVKSDAHSTDWSYIPLPEPRFVLLGSAQ